MVSSGRWRVSRRPSGTSTCSGPTACSPASRRSTSRWRSPPACRQRPWWPATPSSTSRPRTHPGPGLGLYEVYRDAGVPPGVFNFVTGHASAIGDALWQHPGVDGVVFTGSKAVGTSHPRRSRGRPLDQALPPRAGRQERDHRHRDGRPRRRRRGRRALRVRAAEPEVQRDLARVRRPPRGGAVRRRAARPHGRDPHRRSVRARRRLRPGDQPARRRSLPAGRGPGAARGRGAHRWPPPDRRPARPRLLRGADGRPAAALQHALPRRAVRSAASGRRGGQLRRGDRRNQRRGLRSDRRHIYRAPGGDRPLLRRSRGRASATPTSAPAPPPARGRARSHFADGKDRARRARAGVVPITSRNSCASKAAPSSSRESSHASQKIKSRTGARATSADPRVAPRPPVGRRSRATRESSCRRRARGPARSSTATPRGHRPRTSRNIRWSWPAGSGRHDRGRGWQPLSRFHGRHRGRLDRVRTSRGSWPRSRTRPTGSSTSAAPISTTRAWPRSASGWPAWRPARARSASS